MIRVGQRDYLRKTSLAYEYHHHIGRAAPNLALLIHLARGSSARQSVRNREWCSAGSRFVDSDRGRVHNLCTRRIAVGIGVGMVLAAFLFIRCMAEVTQISSLASPMRIRMPALAAIGKENLFDNIDAALVRARKLVGVPVVDS